MVDAYLISGIYEFRARGKNCNTWLFSNFNLNKIYKNISEKLNKGDKISGLKISVDLDIDYEILYVDDCSTDNTNYILNYLAENHKGLIKCLKTSENDGPGKARNIGIDN